MDESKAKFPREEQEEPASETAVPARRSVRSDVLFPATLVGGLLGMLDGTLPASLWYLIFRASFTPLYVLLPLCIYLGIKLFRGFTGRRGMIALCVFSVIGFYLTLLSIQAAAYIMKFQMLFLNLPLVTVTLIGQRGVLTGPVFSSEYAFPFVFSLLGVFLAKELLMHHIAPPHTLEPSSEEHAA
jgi:hypothetical protein